MLIVSANLLRTLWIVSGTLHVMLPSIRRPSQTVNLLMANIVMAYIVMVYIVMAYIGMAYMVMTYIVMGYTVMAYIGTVYSLCPIQLWPAV